MHIHFNLFLEAWLLGDFPAIQQAYSHANYATYLLYKQDSICGTWEKLAEIVDSKACKKLKNSSYQLIGRKKYEWAENITPFLSIEGNRSPSFQHFVKKVNSFLHKQSE